MVTVDRDNGSILVKCSNQSSEAIVFIMNGHSIRRCLRLYPNKRLVSVSRNKTTNIIYRIAYRSEIFLAWFLFR